ncbi:GlgC family sugar phosphate nucleotidyltransferase [Cytobacillus kochii]
MNNRLLGVIDATTYHKGLDELTLHRSLAAVPFAGRYRLIDFILSNMVNSGIESVAIFPKYQYRSLMDHLGSGKNWDLDRKRDGLFFFPSPMIDSSNSGIGSFNHFVANIDYFYRSSQDYALIANCYTVCNIDFSPVLQRHIQSGCDITSIQQLNQPLEMYLVKKDLLIDMIQTRRQTGYTCISDIMADIHQPYTICHYEYKGEAVTIDSVQSYFQASMELLTPDVWRNLFLRDFPIYTKVKDEPPTRYLNGCEVKNSIVANGCQIEGKVENSIIARGVKVGKNTIVRNCVIMQKCEIQEGCVLDSVILDKDVKVEEGTYLTGTQSVPFVVQKGSIQGALMNS